MRNPLTNPLVHCLLLGGLIATIQFINKPLPELYVSQQEIQTFRSELAKTFNNIQDVDNDRIIDKLAEDEILYQQAKIAGFDQSQGIKLRLANVADFLQLTPPNSPFEVRYQAALSMGLDETDIVVRRQMITLYKTAIKNSANILPPSESDVNTFYDEHAEQFMQDARFAFSHVYIQQSDDDGREKASGLSNQLNQNAVTATTDKKAALTDAIRKGDVFYGGHHFNLQSEKQIARHFGQQFAKQIHAVSKNSWSEPILSAFGWHLVWLEASTPKVLKPLEDVRKQIERELTMIAQDERYEQHLQELRNQYRVVVESVEPGISPDAANSEEASS